MSEDTAVIDDVEAPSEETTTETEETTDAATETAAPADPKPVKKAAKKKAVKKPAVEKAAPKKKAVKKAAKKAVKKAAKKKAAKKAGGKKGSRPARDDARLVSKASGGKLRTVHVRILRACYKHTREKPTNMQDVFHKSIYVDPKSPHQRYGALLVNGVRKMGDDGFLRVEKHEESRAYELSITAKGKKVLDDAEAAAKKAAKEEVKAE